MNTTLQQSLYKLVQTIPRGKVLRYKDLALALSIHPRQVGYWLHKNPNPQQTPCHRVVSAQGKLAQAYAFGGAMEQEKKLRFEGVVFQKTGKVDLSKSLFVL